MLYMLFYQVDLSLFLKKKKKKKKSRPLSHNYFVPMFYILKICMSSNKKNSHINLIILLLLLNLNKKYYND